MRRMTVATAVLIAATLAGTAVNAEAASKPRPVKKHSRSVTLTYKPGPTTHSAVGVGSVQGCLGAVANCLNFDTAKDEKYLTITSTDASGRPVGLSMFPNTGTNGVSTETFVCGSTKNAPIAPKSSWTIAADTASADPSCPGVATQGTITVTLSNLP